MIRDLEKMKNEIFVEIFLPGIMVNILLDYFQENFGSYVLSISLVDGEEICFGDLLCHRDIDPGLFHCLPSLLRVVELSKHSACSTILRFLIEEATATEERRGWSRRLRRLV